MSLTTAVRKEKKYNFKIKCDKKDNRVGKERYQVIFENSYNSSE